MSFLPFQPGDRVSWYGDDAVVTVARERMVAIRRLADGFPIITTHDALHSQLARRPTTVFSVEGLPVVDYVAAPIEPPADCAP